VCRRKSHGKRSIDDIQRKIYGFLLFISFLVLCRRRRAHSRASLSVSPDQITHHPTSNTQQQQNGQAIGNNILHIIVSRLSSAALKLLVSQIKGLTTKQAVKNGTWKM
jgi:hypothetical protein